MSPDFNLTSYNTLALTSVASFGIEVKSVDELKDAFRFSHEKQLPFLPLGQGSNVVLPGKLDAVVAVNRILGREVVYEDDTQVHIKVGSGENWHQFVAYALEQGWFGLENLALIPGCIGAAPVQNIGAYGVELKDRFVELEALEYVSGKLRVFSLDDCQFAYRDSVFKRECRNKVVITSVTVKLTKQPQLVLDYPALRNTFVASELPTVSPQQVFEAVCDIRSSKLPNPIDLPNAGSFFKNPIITKAQWESVSEKYPDVIFYPAGDQYKLAAGWLIEKLGWKGKRLGPVGMHEQQALVLINYESATQSDVRKLAGRVAEDVKTHFGVALEIEPPVYNTDCTLA